MDSIMGKVNVHDKLSQFSDYWHPRIVGELNGQHVKLAKLLGEFPWHSHEHEDEMFFVVKGAFELQFRNETIYLEEGEFFIVPKGVEHRPVAAEEVHVMLFEPITTVNTGELTANAFTRKNLESL
jgi:mannose-6-phosphate isomerase-like protein (cupin superfamily)